MFTITVGRAAVALYNLRHQTALSEKAFFDQVFHRLFFDDDRYLLWINNSPLHQNHVYKNARNPLERSKGLQDLHHKISKTNSPLGHLTIGGKAEDNSKTTTGQFNTQITVSDSDSYSSWIGAGLGIRVSGGLCFVINNTIVINALLEGWPLYRRWLQQSPTFEGKQIETWNGWWLIHRFSDNYNPDFPLENFSAQDNVINKEGNGFQTASWTHVLFSISHALQDVSTVGYVYALGNTNKTIGFVVFDVPAVRNLVHLYATLFGQQGPAARAIAEVWESEYGFQRACSFGLLGLKSLQPKGLRNHIQKPSGGADLPSDKPSDALKLSYRQYLTWIVAMLNNNKDLLALADEVAQTLHRLNVADTRGKTTQLRQVDAVREATSRKPLIDALTPLLERSTPEERDALNRLVETVVTMPAADVPLLLALVRFKYAFHGQTL